MLERLKRQMRPRLWIALFVGVVAGAMMWLVPPMPDHTVQLPQPEGRENGQGNAFVLHAITSDARYLVTMGNHDDGDNNSKIYIWDRQLGTHEVLQDLDALAIIQVFFHLSPDESQLVGVGSPWIGPEKLHGSLFYYDFAASRLLKEVATTHEHTFFSRDGKLLTVTRKLGESIVREMETGIEIRRLPEKFNDFALNHFIGACAIYRQDQHARVYSLETGEWLASHDLVGNMMSITHLSRDGKVVSAYGWPPGTGPWTAGSFHILNDAVLDVRVTSDKFPMFRKSVVSPDGKHLVEFGVPKRPAWLPKWVPLRQAESSAMVSHWTTKQHLGEFPGAVDVVFSPRGNQLAVVRDDGVIDVYAFPFAKPWSMIAGVAFLAALGSWTLAWAWAVWRSMRLSPLSPGTPGERGRG